MPARGDRDELYYSWSKAFLQAGKRRLSGDTARQASAPEVKELRAEASALEEAVADLTLENRLLKNCKARCRGIRLVTHAGKEARDE